MLRKAARRHDVTVITNIEDLRALAAIDRRILLPGTF